MTTSWERLALEFQASSISGVYINVESIPDRTWNKNSNKENNSIKLIAKTIYFFIVDTSLVYLREPIKELMTSTDIEIARKDSAKIINQFDSCIDRKSTRLNSSH